MQSFVWRGRRYPAQGLIQHEVSRQFTIDTLIEFVRSLEYMLAQSEPTQATASSRHHSLWFGKSLFASLHNRP
jgi:hypothetical protein